MKCRIKRVGNDSYFNKNISSEVNHWTPRRECRVFKDDEQANKIIEKYKLKNVEVEYDK